MYNDTTILQEKYRLKQTQPELLATYLSFFVILY